MDASVKIACAAEKLHSKDDMLETKLKVVEVASKVMEAIGFGNCEPPNIEKASCGKSLAPFHSKNETFGGSGKS